MTSSWVLSSQSLPEGGEEVDGGDEINGGVEGAQCRLGTHVKGRCHGNVPGFCCAPAGLVQCGTATGINGGMELG